MPQKQPTLDQIQKEIVKGVQQVTGPEFKAINSKFEVINHKFDDINHKFDDINHKFEVIDINFAAVNERFKMVDENFDEIRKQIGHLPTKKEFFNYMDKMMGELKTIRQEQAVNNHRITVLEQKVLI